MSKNNKNTNNNKIKNMYEIMPKNLVMETWNPNYKNHLLNLSGGGFKMIIVGASGAGKTNVALEIIRRMTNTFQNIYIVCKDASEPLYQFLKMNVQEGLHLLEGIDKIPNLDKDIDTIGQTLIIFDDLVLEKNQKPIEEYFIRCRKKRVSALYLSQSFFKIPKTIRVNTDYVIIKKLANNRDLNLILSEYNLGLKKDTMYNIYKYCTENPLDFLLIDVGAPSENKFRHNFLEIINTTNLV
jgi:hypothetical protein